MIVMPMPPVYEYVVKCKNDFLSKEANKQTNRQTNSEAHVAKGAAAVEFLGLKCNNQSNKLPNKMIQALGQRVADICIMVLLRLFNSLAVFVVLLFCCFVVSLFCCAYYLFVFMFSCFFLIVLAMIL